MNEIHMTQKPISHLKSNSLDQNVSIVWALSLLPRRLHQPFTRSVVERTRTPLAENIDLPLVDKVAVS